MNFNEVSDRVRYLVNEDTNIMMFLGTETKFARDRVVLVIEDLKKRMENDDVERDEKLIKAVINFNYFLIEKVVTAVLEDSTKEFLNKYSLLVYNWACAVGDQNLITNCQALTNILSYEKSLIGLIDATKILIRQIKKFDNFKPAAFDISRAYLDQLYINLKEGEDKNAERK